MRNLLAFLVVCALLLALTSSYKLGQSPLSMALKTGESCLIVQNKGGGHGSIAYHLSNSILKQAGYAKITILQDKASYSKEPFKSYSELEARNIKIVQMKPPNPDGTFELPDELRGEKFDFVVDNWSKSPENAEFVCKVSKDAESKQLVFISSAGMYQTSGVQPIIETDPVKSSNGARKVEQIIEKSGLKYTFLRPQYLYGAKASKRYLDFFIGRSVRNLPVPVPLSGDQLVCLTNLEDLADLIATAIGHPEAVNEIFNAGTDRYISYKGLCSAIMTALGRDSADAKLISYDPAKFEWDGKLEVSEFPFRPQTFVTSVDKAKQALGWKPKSILIEDLKTEVDEYVQSSRAAESWSFPELRYDLEASAAKDPNSIFNYSFFKAKSGAGSVNDFKSAMDLISRTADASV